METRKQVLTWLQNQTTFVASVIAIAGAVGSWVNYGVVGPIFLAMLVGGLVFLVGKLSSRLVQPSESARFQALRDEIVACRDLQVAAERDRDDVEAVREANAAFTELRMRLLSVHVKFPGSGDLAERRRWLNVLSGLAVDGQVKNARRVGRQLRGVE